MARNEISLLAALPSGPCRIGKPINAVANVRSILLSIIAPAREDGQIVRCVWASRKSFHVARPRLRRCGLRRLPARPRASRKPASPWWLSESGQSKTTWPRFEICSASTIASAGLRGTRKRNGGTANGPRQPSAGDERFASWQGISGPLRAQGRSSANPIRTAFCGG